MPRPEQIKREQLTEREWSYMKHVLFPGLRDLKASINARRNQRHTSPSSPGVSNPPCTSGTF